MINESLTLRVVSIRSHDPKGFGGCIFAGRPIDGIGDVVDPNALYVVRASGRFVNCVKVQLGQWWTVTGEANEITRVVNGYRVTEKQIEATSAALLRTSGEHIVSFIADSADFRGIGRVKARKLWDHFGSDLYRILDQKDHFALASVLSADVAKQIVDAWTAIGDSHTLQWLQNQGIEVEVGAKLIKFFGIDARQKIEEDPYRLLSFCATWSRVDALALAQFNVAVDDPRRLQGAVEEALYRIFAEGDTVTTTSVVVARLMSVLGPPTSKFKWRGLIDKTLSQGLTNGSYLMGSECNTIHPIGPYVMELNVARDLIERLHSEQSSVLLDSARVDQNIADYESTERIRLKDENFSLNPEQRQAIRMANEHPFSIIIGGAGVGKTTVLKALYRIYDEAGIRIFQMALPGKAAKRMLEATGRSASTIASFLKSLRDEDMRCPTVVVIDEASMIDIITMNRLCNVLLPHVRLVLAGDPGQLMPVGPGLVLHALVELDDIPKVELKTANRFGSEIAEAADHIRRGKWPTMPNDLSAPIAFVPCTGPSIAQVVISLYEQNRNDTQILTPRRNSFEGTKALNSRCQILFSTGARHLLVWSHQHDMHAGTGFFLGDPLLCTRNRWDLGLQNGALGTLTEIEDLPRLIHDSDGEEIGHAIGWIDWDDGQRRPLFESMLDDLELGYAITVHKSQGSQWRRVIVPLTGNRLLDRTLVYTAITRAQAQVIIVGDAEVAKDAVESAPKADSRKVAIGQFLQRFAKAGKSDKFAA